MEPASRRIQEHRGDRLCPLNTLSVAGRPIFLAPAALVLMLAGAFLAASIAGSRCLASTPGGAPGAVPVATVVPTATKDCVETALESHKNTIDVSYYVVTCILIGVGFLFTYRALRAQDQTNMFEVFTEVHKALCNDRSYSIRGYLHEKFSDDLAKAIQSLAKTHGPPWNGKLSVDGCSYINAGMVEMHLDVTEMERPRHLSEFRNALKLIATNVAGVNALEAAELTLLDFDLIAVPFCHDNASARKIAEAYRTVLRDTAPLLLPFVTIQHKLRKADSWYKWHYRFMLQELIKSHDFEVTVPESLQVPSPLPPKRSPHAPGPQQRPNRRSNVLFVACLIAGVAVPCLSTTNVAADGYLKCDNNVDGISDYAQLIQKNASGVTLGYDSSRDGSFLAPIPGEPGIYSDISFIEPVNSRLKKDWRPSGETTPFSIRTVYNGTVLVSAVNYLTVSFPNGFGMQYEDKSFLSLYQTTASGAPIPGKAWDVRDVIANHSGTIDLDPLPAGTYNVNSPYAYFRLDFEPLVQLLPGDANGNGVVDTADYITLKRNFGLGSGATWGQGDFTGDGKVDWNDLQVLMASFGTGAGGLTAQTPEPGTLGLLALGGLGLLAKRKQRKPSARRARPLHRTRP